MHQHWIKEHILNNLDTSFPVVATAAWGCFSILNNLCISHFYSFSKTIRTQSKTTKTTVSVKLYVPCTHRFKYDTKWAGRIIQAWRQVSHLRQLTRSEVEHGRGRSSWSSTAGLEVRGIHSLPGIGCPDRGEHLGVPAWGRKAASESWREEIKDEGTLRSRAEQKYYKLTGQGSLLSWWHWQAAKLPLQFII